MASDERLPVEVAISRGPDDVRLTPLSLAVGATVADALRAAGLEAAGDVGVWGRPQALGHVLRARDRVEVYRPLQVDPKEARRLRYKRQRAGSRSR